MNDGNQTPVNRSKSSSGYATETDVKNPESFLSTWKLYTVAKKSDVSITLGEVEVFLEG